MGVKQGDILDLMTQEVGERFAKRPSELFPAKAWDTNSYQVKQWQAFACAYSSFSAC
jgi:hypothetical protein